MSHPASADDPAKVPASAAVDVAVIGAGLAGGLLALALARRGGDVALLDAGAGRRATACSYGVLQPGAAWAWRRLQRHHGDLGLRGLPVRLHGGPGWRSWRPPLPLCRVDGAVLAQALPAALARVGVLPGGGSVLEPPQRSAGHWQLSLPGRAPLQAKQVVLAAGAGCRPLWPALPPALQTSWAGVLELASLPPLARLPRGGALLPAVFQRPALERTVAQREVEAWVVDPGLVPSGAGWLAGQISLVCCGRQEPDPQLMEHRLRQGLGTLDPALVDWPGRYRQVPVSFCWDGQPLAGPVSGATGLWVCAGFSGGFSQMPVAVERLAAAVVQRRQS